MPNAKYKDHTPFLTLNLGAKFREVPTVSQLLLVDDHSLLPIAQPLHGFE